MVQYYKITNIKNLRSYIGIVLSPNKTYLDRFIEHMEGKGSIWIWREIQSGISSKDDFIVEMILETNHSTDVDDLENTLIRYHDTLYPTGYNGNCGKHIIVTDETKQKSRETYQKNKDLGRHKSTGRPGMAVYRYENGTVAKLATSHPDILSGAAKHINYDPDAEYRIRQRRLENEKIKNNGKSDRQILFSKRMKESAKTYPSLESWQQGRQKYRERLNAGKFTEKELKSFENRSVIVKEQWDQLSTNQRKKRTTSGLSIMNSSVQCEHCGKLTNQGNYSRWHGQQCKKNR